MRRNVQPEAIVDIHRALPHSVEAEQGVIGSMLISPREIIPSCKEQITPEYFYIPSHQTIYSVLVDLWRSGTGIDLITFTQVLRDRNLLDTVGGASFVTSLFTFVPTAANVGYYLEIVRDKYILREIISACTEGARRAYESQGEIEELLTEVKKKLSVIDPTTKRQKDIREIMSDMRDSLNHVETVLGIPTGFASLDAEIGGFAPKHKVTIAGASSSGKSALAEQFAVMLAVKKGIPTAIFTFEMSAEEKAQRLAQIHSGVSLRNEMLIAQPDMMRVDAFDRAVEEISNAPLWIIDNCRDSDEIRARCVSLKAKGLRIIEIDYLQITPGARIKGETTTERFDRLSFENKMLARDLDTTVIELSQVTVDEKTGKTTTRYSSGITNDADKLIVIVSGEDSPDKPRCDKELVVAKQRNGGRNVAIPFIFHKPTTTFREKKSTY